MMNPTHNTTPPQIPQLAESGGANNAPQPPMQAAQNPPASQPAPNQVGEQLAAPPQQELSSQASQSNPVPQQAQAAAPEQEVKQEAAAPAAKTGVNQGLVDQFMGFLNGVFQLAEKTLGKETAHEIINNCKNMAAEKFGLGQIMNLASNAKAGGGIFGNVGKMFGFGGA